MSIRKIDQVDFAGGKVVIRKDSACQEYILALYAGTKKVSEYFTDDLDDALATAEIIAEGGI